MARPRSEEARRKAIAAAIDLIIERGVANLSIEEVAARSGVAKTTIYRRWPERASLIIDTVRSTFEHVTTPDTGSLRTDLAAYFDGMIRADLNGKVGKLIPSLLDAATRDPEIGTLMDRFSIERQQPLMTMVARAQERGELPPDLDRDVVVGTVIGPIVFRKVVQRRPVDAAYVAKCLDVTLTGLGAKTVQPTG
ncbi:MAG: TetR/AcrR family transcriptional regulator [Ilumatobacteraceae bacterium]